MKLVQISWNQKNFSAEQSTLIEEEDKDLSEKIINPIRKQRKKTSIYLIWGKILEA